MAATALERYYQAVFSDPILREFWGGSGFANLGYWDASTPDAAAAGERLIDELVALLPEARGSILDVACGEGATTRSLLRTFPAAAVTAINISESQLAAARERAPGVSFLKMDATDLRFPDSSFTNVICVEAAFHFDTRERFLEEALRVLEPGGHLLISDLLFAPYTPLVPRANHVASPAAYEALLRRVGFDPVTVVDAHDEMWRSFRRRFNSFVLGNVSRFGWYLSWRDLVASSVSLSWLLRGGVLAAAGKPALSTAESGAGRRGRGRDGG